MVKKEIQINFSSTTLSPLRYLATSVFQLYYSSSVMSDDHGKERMVIDSLDPFDIPLLPSAAGIHQVPRQDYFFVH